MIMTVKTHTIGLRGDDPYYLRMRTVREEQGCSWAEASRIVYGDVQTEIQALRDRLSVAEGRSFNEEITANEVQTLKSRLSAAEQVAKDTTSLRIRCTRAEGILAEVEVEISRLRALKEKVDALQVISAFLGGDSEA